MDIISAVKAAQESSSMTIRRKDGVILTLDFPIRVKREEPNPKRPYCWNPTVRDILADDWEVVVFDAKIPND